jgi:SAM-dependent methyltransferase
MSRVASCRLCGAAAAGLEIVLDLGPMPLANRLLRPDDLGRPEPRYPLQLARCPHCDLLQLTETIPPEALYREYLYCSSCSDDMLAHARALAERLIAERRISSGSFVVEAASNDGYLLQHFVSRGIPACGVEPARNLAALARSRGVPTLDEFFSTALAERLRPLGRLADVFLALNVLGHVHRPNDFVRGIARLLAPGGLAVIEVPYARDMVEQGEFDTIYHEHLSYYTVATLDRLLRQNGLTVQGVERVPIHGGSLRLFAVPRGAAERGRSVQALLAEEATLGVGDPAYARRLAGQADAVRRELGGLLRRLRAEGKRLAAYGAAAKGSTLLNYLGVGRETLAFVADRSPLKQGQLTPGSRLPICSPSRLLEEMPDYVLLLTWNFANEILRQQQEYLQRGGRLILPIPQLRVVSRASLASELR